MSTRLIAFDVDSTLLTVESLDVAISAALAGHPEAEARREALHRITQAGMSGELAMADSLAARLKLADLDARRVAAIAFDLRSTITAGMADMLRELRERGNQVYAISGGFRDLLDPVLSDLAFAPEHRFANRFEWGERGVEGVDTSIALSRNGGKAEVLKRLMDQTGHATAWLVGDGMTDCEASDAPGIRFIGFAQNADRPAVRAAAVQRGQVFTNTLTELRSVLLD